MAIIKPNLSNLKNFKLKIKKSTICCTSFFPGILSGEIRNTKLPVLDFSKNPKNANFVRQITHPRMHPQNFLLFLSRSISC